MAVPTIKVPIFRGMSEAAIRAHVASLANSFLGVREGSDSHREIVEVYNAHRPLARGYKLKDTDAWCAAFLSYLAITLGITDIFPTEVGVGKMMELFQKLGSFIESDSYVPKPGDVIFFDWEDDGKGECRGYPNHVGLVEEVIDGFIFTIEANYENRVKTRKIAVGARYIRGFASPKYASLVWGFSDVPEGEWYTPAVDWAEELGIIEGVAAQVFAPEQVCTRAHVIATMYRLPGSVEVKGPNPFADVDPDAYYADAVRWAHKLGVTEGLSDMAFGPDEPCTRAQIVTMIWRRAGKPKGSYAPFDDIVPEAFYADAVDWAYSKGIVYGINDYDFAPDQPCTRAEMVAMLHRYAA